MGSQTVRLHHDHLLVKEPGTTLRTPWHQQAKAMALFIP